MLYLCKSQSSLLLFCVDSWLPAFHYCELCVKINKRVNFIQPFPGLFFRSYFGAYILFQLVIMISNIFSVLRRFLTQWAVHDWQKYVFCLIISLWMLCLSGTLIYIYSLQLLLNFLLQIICFIVRLCLEWHKGSKSLLCILGLCHQKKNKNEEDMVLVVQGNFCMNFCSLDSNGVVRFYLQSNSLHFGGVMALFRTLPMFCDYSILFGLNVNIFLWSLCNGYYFLHMIWKHMQ